MTERLKIAHHTLHNNEPVTRTSGIDLKQEQVASRHPRANGHTPQVIPDEMYTPLQIQHKISDDEIIYMDGITESDTPSITVFEQMAHDQARAKREAAQKKAEDWDRRFNPRPTELPVPDIDDILPPQPDILP